MSRPFRIETELRIEAPPARVWDVVTDLSGYAGWNPWIVSVAGARAVGAELRLKSVHVPGGAPSEGLVILTALDFPEMRWEGGHPDREVLKGDHLFRCEADGAGCLFRHSESFTGISAERLVADYGARIEANFRRFNAALKRVCEG